MFFVLVGMMVLVGAATWDETANNVTYWTAEEILYTHNLSANVTNLIEGDIFSIAPGAGVYIYWNDVVVNLSDIEDWIFIENSTTGNLTINAVYNNQTGAFRLPLRVKKGTGSETQSFNFTVNATNDIPNFTLNSDYNVSVPSSGNTTKNINLTGSDEESQYPLEYNVTFFDCSFASWSSRNNSDCSLDYDMINLSNTTSMFALSNLTYNDVGVYNLTICVHDNINGSSLPAYPDSDYAENKSYCQNTTLNLLSSLSINASDCEQSLTEGDWLNCTINITTIGKNDNINISSDSYFRNDANDPHNRSWFQSSESMTAVDFLVSVNVSILLDKEEVGNWTINFSADDGISPISLAEIDLFVNFNESNVSMGSIADLSGDDALYENYSFEINATDNDLLIWDDSVKKEQLIFVSNESDWISITYSNGGDSMFNYKIAQVDVNYDYIYNNGLGLGNYSINISVSDNASNSDYKIFTIEILNDTMPVWNDEQYNFSIDEDNSSWGGINLSEYVDGASLLDFSYVNDSEFDGFNLSNASGEWIINFMPTDVDVGYHNITITADNGNLDSSHYFNFTINNIVDSPIFWSPLLSIENATEDVLKTIELNIKDEDFLIPSNQSDFYDESLTINLTFNNSANNNSISFDFVLVLDPDSDGIATYQASFTPDGVNVGDYNVTINVTDVGGASNVSYFTLNISETNDAPNLTFVENQSWTINDIFYLDINATDEEDGNDSSGNLTYSLNFSLGDDFVNGNESIFNTTSGIFNLTLNSSYAGEYDINISVNDTSGAVDWQIFNLKIYGVPNITAPLGNEFNWDEANATGDLEFEVDYAINNTDLIYRFYLDRIVYSNTTYFSYTDLIADASLRNETNYSWTDNANYSWNLTPSYTDESYGMLKNLTLVVFNPDYPELNDSVNWKVNVTHTNQNVSFTEGAIQDQDNCVVGTSCMLYLDEYFEDVDYWDKAINQVVNFTIETIAPSTNNIESASSFSGWNLSLGSAVETTETIKVTAHEYTSDNISFLNVSSNEFNVTFTNPVEIIVEVPRTKTSTRTVVKYYSLRIIVPRDIIISQQGFIDVPFSLQNSGQMDLKGISLDNLVRFNDVFSDDVSISLDDNYIEELKIGQSKDFNLRIVANTQRVGRYKATIIANVTSPKFSDWADFFIEIEKANESEAEQILIFTEKFIVENPECLELTEIFRRAEDAFAAGDYSTTMSLAQEAITACEEAIKIHEQIRYKVEGAVRDNFYYILFATLALFFMGFVFYVYKRVRFNKSETDEYV